MKRPIRIYIEDALGVVCLFLTIYASAFILPVLFGG